MREARIDGFVLAIDYRWLMGGTVRTGAAILIKFINPN
jgi:hypothetical protein